MTKPRSRRRWPAAVALVVYAACLAVVLLAPLAQLQIAVVARTAQVLTLLLPDGIVTVTGTRVEVGLNAVMVVPLASLATLVFARVRWQDWTAYGFLGACAVELVQGLVLQGRSATFVDVVANTFGGFVGSVVGTVLVRWSERDRPGQGLRNRHEGRHAPARGGEAPRPQIGS